MGQPFINSIALMFLTALTGIATTWIWKQKAAAERKAEKLAEEHAALEATVHKLELQLGAVGAAVLPINAAFQAILIKQLTHFHTPEMDALMVKLGPPITLTPAEEDRLFVLLQQRAVELNGNIDELERDAARMLPMVMRRVKAEAEAVANAPTQLKIVTVVPESDPYTPETPATEATGEPE